MIPALIGIAVAAVIAVASSGESSKEKEEREEAERKLAKQRQQREEVVQQQEQLKRTQEAEKQAKLNSRLVKLNLLCEKYEIDRRFNVYSSQNKDDILDIMLTESKLLRTYSMQTRAVEQNLNSAKQAYAELINLN